MSDPKHNPDIDKQTPQPRISGSCLCGASKYTVSQPTLANICHCKSCQKWTGSAFISQVWSSKSTLHLSESASENVRMYADSNTDSGNTLNRHFCGTCGSSLYTTAAHMPDAICITTGTIDGVVGGPKAIGDAERLAGMTPQLELYCKNKASWLDTAASIQKYDEMPTESPRL